MSKRVTEGFDVVAIECGAPCATELSLRERSLETLCVGDEIAAELQEFLREQRDDS